MCSELFLGVQSSVTLDKFKASFCCGIRTRTWTLLAVGMKSETESFCLHVQKIVVNSKFSLFLFCFQADIQARKARKMLILKFKQPSVFTISFCFSINSL